MSNRPTAERRRPPDRCASLTQKAKISGQTVHLCFQEYPDGTLAGIFIDIHKAGSALRALLTGVATFVSLSIQYGMPLAAVVGVMRDVEFLPAGHVQADGSEVTQARSVLDYIAQEIQETYLADLTPPAEQPAPVEKVAGTPDTGKGW